MGNPLDKIIPREVREFGDKVIPNELKPYFGTAVATAIPFGGGLVGGFLGGGLTDILMQKLLYDEDTDRDTDYLSALMSGTLSGIKGYGRTDAGIIDKLTGKEGGGLYGEGTKPRFVKPGTKGLMLDPNDPTKLVIDQGADSRFLEARPENLAQVGGFKDPTGASIAQSTLDAGYRIGEGGFKEGLSNVFDASMDTLLPLTSFKVDPNAPMGLDNISLGSVSSGLTGLQVAQTPSQVRDAKKALEEAEREYQNYLNTLEADQRASIEADMNERIAAYKQYMSLAGFTNAEIDDALINAGYLASGETVYAAQGGRIGFANGTDSMGIGNYIEAENVRTEFMDKIQRMLQAEEMNMKLNDPGIMRFGNALMPGGEGFYTRQEMAFPDMKARYEQMIEQMKMDQAADDYEKDQIKKQLRKDEFDDIVNMIDDRFSDNREQRKMASVGGRMTSEGDPISPDVPPGMQMDLRPGGFIPLGTKPKADDVPAMVGKNEFVLNDEAVSGIGKLLTGQPDPRAGARALYELQNQMEAIV